MLAVVGDLSPRPPTCNTSNVSSAMEAASKGDRGGWQEIIEVRLSGLSRLVRSFVPTQTLLAACEASRQVGVHDPRYSAHGCCVLHNARLDGRRSYFHSSANYWHSEASRTIVEAVGQCNRFYLSQAPYRCVRVRVPCVIYTMTLSFFIQTEIRPIGARTSLEPSSRSPPMEAPKTCGRRPLLFSSGML